MSNLKQEVHNVLLRLGEVRNQPAIATLLDDAYDLITRMAAELVRAKGREPTHFVVSSGPITQGMQVFDNEADAIKWASEPRLGDLFNVFAVRKVAVARKVTPPAVVEVTKL